MREKLHKAGLASIKDEMALPRVLASATKAIARQEKSPIPDYPGRAGEDHICFRWRICQSREQIESKPLFCEQGGKWIAKVLGD